ncbi:MAG TPA: AMP-binding protein, partial [Dongiaceae bacterium]|nr:AMP-binding protein [Dongiaceae bacterium]
MPWHSIPKSGVQTGTAPNLRDYGEARRTFSWASARLELDGLPGGALNIAHEAIGRHLTRGRGEHLALRWLGKTGTTLDLSYAELGRRTARFANTLRTLGIGKSDRVFGLMGRIPELYIAALGTLRNGSVFSPLFSAFGPEPIRSRMELGDAKVLVTTEALYRKKVMTWRHELPKLTHVLLAECDEAALPEGTLSLAKAMASASDQFTTE